jgi:hypothetical protein|tara:strand:+ start:529 stop:699 length:171 start_codon:yes stop_codon:yes gene_type:complete
MAKRGRKRTENPTEHTIYMRGYRAGEKSAMKKIQAPPSPIENVFSNMFSVFKSRQL